MKVKELIEVLSEMPQDCEVRICSTDSPYYKDGCHLARGILKKGDAPKVGDRVKLRYRRRKSGYEGFDMDNAKIVEIING